MKKPILLVMAICTLIFFGCSTDSSENFNNEEQSQTQLSGEQQADIPTIQITDFKIVGSGLFVPSSTKACNTKAELLNKGESTTGVFGNLFSQFSVCTDFEGYNYFSGSYTTDEGDQFWFTSDQSGEDQLGKWYLYIIDGGTGIFENASGEITVYRLERFDSENEGTFTDSGKGIINY